MEQSGEELPMGVGSLNAREKDEQQILRDSERVTIPSMTDVRRIKICRQRKDWRTCWIFRPRNGKTDNWPEEMNE
jgi:hypothetical protein